MGVIELVLTHHFSMQIKLYPFENLSVTTFSVPLHVSWIDLSFKTRKEN